MGNHPILTLKKSLLRVQKLVIKGKPDRMIDQQDLAKKDFKITLKTNQSEN
jgi:hypothetical protein